MTERIAEHPAVLGIAWPAAIGAAAVTFLLTVVMPPVGFLVGAVALAVLGVGLARRRTNWVTAVSAGVVSAVVCYLGIWLVSSIFDPGAAASDQGSPAPQFP